MTTLPAALSSNDKVILFDGKCKLCNFSVRFIIDHDPEQIFKLAWVQSSEGQQILEYFDMNTEYFDTVVYIDEDHFYTKSDAAIQIFRQLAYPWKVLSFFKIIPVTVRDYLYDWIAFNRYRFFGQYDYCLVPSAAHEKRFLGNH